MRYLNALSIVLTIAAVLVALAGPVWSQVVWDDRAEFSVDSNPNGPWTYGCLNRDGEFAAYNSTFELGDGIVGWCMDDDPDACGNVTVNTSGKPVEKFGVVWEPGQILAHPGLFGCKAVVRWTSPVSGRLGIGIGLSVQSMHGAPAGVEVKHRDASITQRLVDGFAGKGQRKDGRSGSIPEIGLNPDVTMNRGETFDVIVSSIGAEATGHVSVSIAVAATGHGDSTSEGESDANKTVGWSSPLGESLVAFLVSRDYGLKSIGASLGLHSQTATLRDAVERG